MQKVEWAMMMVSSPRPDGQPMVASMATNNNNRARPVMTSGMTNGAETVAASTVRPRKRRNRTRATAQSVPSTRAMVALAKATWALSQAAPKSWGSLNTAAYHLVEKPDQTVTSSLSLNEKMTSDRI